jgi:hypothetical protein
MYSFPDPPLTPKTKQTLTSSFVRSDPLSHERKKQRVGSSNSAAGGGGGIAAAIEGSLVRSSDGAVAEDGSGPAGVVDGCLQQRPPPFDWNGDALEVFSTPFFYPSKHAAASVHSTRVSKLGGWTVGAVLETFHNLDHLHALAALASAIGARPSRVQAYYDTANIATKQKLAAIALKAAYRCDFQVAQIEESRIESAVRPLLHKEAPSLASHESGTGRTIDVSFLGPLNLSREVFSEAACDRTAAAANSSITGPSIETRASIECAPASQADTDLSTEHCLNHANGGTFLAADALHVRDCMREVFGLFHADVARDPRPVPSVTSSAVLVGSPGVGKSTLFFLAALDQARKSRTVYYRHPDSEDVSVFFMEPDESHEGHVRVWFTPNVKLNQQQSLTLLNSDIESSLSLSRTDYYVFIDGPKYNEDDKSNVLMNGYDYFCTSGGRAPYKSAQLYNRLWVLDGWSEGESIEWLVEFQRRRDEHMGGKSTCEQSQEGGNDGVQSEGEDTGGEASRHDRHDASGATDIPISSEYSDIAKKAYWLCGGNMREMLSSLGPPSTRDRVQGRIDVSLGRNNKETIDLVLNSTERCSTNADRLRTMFRDRGAIGDWRMEMSALQIVDSGYVLRNLRDRRRLQDFVTAYNELWTHNIRAPQGCIFELILHQVITDNQCLPGDDEGRFPIIDKVVWSQGTQGQSAEKLSDPNVLWIPSKQKFPDIDSVLVHNGTLFVFQMKIREKHGMDESTFLSKFVSIVDASLPLTRATVCFVHPHDAAFATSRSATRQSVRLAESKRKVPVTYESHGVNMSSLKSISDSLMELFRRIGQRADTYDTSSA